MDIDAEQADLCHWFPASLSWSSSEGFNGRITNNSWRELQPAAQAADA
jgi:hypothetical protein